MNDQKVGYCILESKGFDFNAVLFDIAGFKVTWLYLILAVVLVIIIFGGKK